MAQNLVTHLKMISAGMLFLDMSTAQYEAFLLKGSMDKLLRSSRSRLPISIKVPFSAMHRQDSCNMSPVSEFRITSTPRPSVASISCVEKSVEREEKMRCWGML